MPASTLRTTAPRASGAASRQPASSRCRAPSTRPVMTSPGSGSAPPTRASTARVRSRNANPRPARRNVASPDRRFIAGPAVRVRGRRPRRWRRPHHGAARPTAAPGRAWPRCRRCVYRNDQWRPAARAVARPIPPLAPVTTTTRRSSWGSFWRSSLWSWAMPRSKAHCSPSRTVGRARGLGHSPLAAGRSATPSEDHRPPGDSPAPQSGRARPGWSAAGDWAARVRCSRTSRSSPA